jgi:hypothetical protein
MHGKNFRVGSVLLNRHIHPHVVFTKLIQKTKTPFMLIGPNINQVSLLIRGGSIKRKSRGEVS